MPMHLFVAGHSSSARSDSIPLLLLPPLLALLLAALLQPIWKKLKCALRAHMPRPCIVTDTCVVDNIIASEQLCK